jgi:mono/diheme cytochrome c family protein/glucose/arabinose dehydrogenase
MAFGEMMRMKPSTWLGNTSRRNALRIGLSALVVGLLATTAARSQEEQDEQSPYVPGLIGIYSGPEATTARRVDETIAFAWGSSSPDPRLPAGPFTAQWTGYIFVQSPGLHRLYVHADGQVNVRVLDQVAIDRRVKQAAWTASPDIELPFGWHPLKIEYRRAGDAGDAGDAQFALYWSGPRFEVEPVSSRFLFHDRGSDVDAAFARGERLARALRCDACHRAADSAAAAQAATIPAPALEHVRGNIFGGWLVNWLDDGGEQSSANAAHAKVTASNANGESAASEPPKGGTPAGIDLQRRMPYFAFEPDESRALAAYLAGSPADSTSEPQATLAADREVGRQLFLTIGCLACHGLESLGEAGLFGGGNLSHIAAKRPAAFFETWLADPARLNARHRMPVFELEPDERRKLAAFLAGQGQPAEAVALLNQDIARGRQLFAEARCAACHGPPETERQADSKLSLARPLSAASNWNASCAGVPRTNRRQPGYQLPADDGQALLAYYAARRSADEPVSEQITGRWVLAERNCLACHAREQAGGLSSRLPAVVESFPQLSSLMAALTPPSLNSVGDKLHDSALQSAIRRQGAVRRPWLLVRMPRFSLADEELSALTRDLVATDRVPDAAPRSRPDLSVEAAYSTGPRLVTPDGFGCTSCHAVGKVRAPNAPLNTMGPDLLQLDQRIRRPWFERFVRNPARIVPRMEMPSVQTSVGGVLNDELDLQLAAVWHTLNRPDFRPPEPDPLRVVRRSGIADRGERAVWLSDVLQADARSYIKPLLIGLPNRHHLLLDLEQGQLAGWSIGDVARQRTRGKSWFWELAGTQLLFSTPGPSDLGLIAGGQWIAPQRQGQFVTEFDEIRHMPGGAVAVRQRLHFADGALLHVAQEFYPLWDAPSGVRRIIEVRGLPDSSALGFRLCDEPQWKQCRRSADGKEVVLPERGGGSFVRLENSAGARFQADGTVVLAADQQVARLELHYRTPLPVDQFPDGEVAPPTNEIEKLDVVPGFDVVRLGLPAEIMPTGLAWSPAGRLLISSLKGQVWRADDGDGDGLEDTLHVVSDELAAPYGLAAGEGFVDVINKYAMLRLIDEDGDGFCERTVTLASGWGHTDDYHDWAVGLERDEQGNYYVAFPCQQDQRSEAAARYRGIVAQLARREADPRDPRAFEIRPLSAGHRFPMGLARNAAGIIVVTDNQGNYNPFNELNHVRPGAHFGFINALQRTADDRPPPLVPPAINLPHPWTRSVNGVCFLESPRRDASASASASVFGPWEGHLLGCEYDTRKLIRMSLQDVDGTLQGAAYPLSLDYPAQGPTFIGPLVCSVSPQGDVYVGCIRDSGWGGANNIGAVVRLRKRAGELPAGISEVRAEAGGFVIDFSGPVDPRRAADPQNYVLSSYRRLSTPDYGGPYRDRRTERPTSIRFDPDKQRVHLQLDDLRAGFVYEFHLRNLAHSVNGRSGTFFPAEAHYTLQAIPGGRP